MTEPERATQIQSIKVMNSREMSIKMLNICIEYYHNCNRGALLHNLFPNEQEDYRVQRVGLGFTEFWSSLDNENKMLYVSQAHSYYQERW